MAKGTLDSESTAGFSTSNSQIGLQDQQEQDARTSCDQPSGSKLPWETGRNSVDYRIPGVLLSAVDQQDTHRKDKVKQLISEEGDKDSLTRIEWTEKDIMLFDRIASENHKYVATRAERIRHSEQWILQMNQDGPQQPLNEQPDFAQTKTECKKLLDEYMAITSRNTEPFLEDNK